MASERVGVTDAERASVALARIAALERLLAHYRSGTQPSEKLHRELARTKSELLRVTEGFAPTSVGPER